MRASQVEGREGFISATEAGALRPLHSSFRDWAVVLLDPSGHILSWNAPAAALFGYSADEVIGRDLSCLSPDEEGQRDRQENDLGRAATEGRIEEEG